MRKSIAVFIAFAVLAAGGAAWAADTNTLTVNASVLETCKFSSLTSTLNFGTLDPSVGTNISGSTTTQFWCTKGVTTDAIVLDPTHTLEMKHATSPDVIPYTLSLTKDVSSNSGPVSPRTLTIAGNVLGTDYTGKSAGSYLDTVTLTITP